MHAVLHQFLLALVGSLPTRRVHSSRPGAFRGDRGVLLSALGGSKPGTVEPEGHGVQNGSPGVAVMEPGRVDGLGSVEGPACQGGKGRMRWTFWAGGGHSGTKAGAAGLNGRCCLSFSHSQKLPNEIFRGFLPLGKQALL